MKTVTVRQWKITYANGKEWIVTGPPDGNPAEAYSHYEDSPILNVEVFKDSIPMEVEDSHPWAK